MMLGSDKGLEIITRLPEGPVRGEVDQSSFRRMLLILLDKAIKYTPAGGSITMSVTENVTQE
jgi:signal transduction histidine kinase